MLASLSLPTMALATPTTGAGSPAPLLDTASTGALPGRYIVVLHGEPGTAHAAHAATTIARAEAAGVRISHRYDRALNGFAAALSPAQVAALRADPGVAYLAADQRMAVNDTQSPPPSWGLDRVDQRNLPLNSQYQWHNGITGAGVTAYVIDTGIRATHHDFAGRVVPGFSAVDTSNGMTDCNGHGTHVAGTLGGTAHGVAKGVRLVPVKVLACNGSGTVSAAIAGVDWVTGRATRPAVANMSLSGSASAPLDTAVNNSIGQGITYVVAAGNNGSNACGYSPARVSWAITVAATGRTDSRDSYSNYGTCVDIFAPGSGITSAWHTSDSATNTLSGTSQASPHVAGAAALYLQTHPDDTISAVSSWIVLEMATRNVVTNTGTGTPNRLLYTLGVSKFATWACLPNTRMLSGDFDGDDRDDLALTGATGGSIPVAFSTGNGRFRLTNQPQQQFATWAATPGVQAVSGDFDGDGRDDLALAGGADWNWLAVGYSNGDGTFRPTPIGLPSFPALARVTGAQLLSGDFDGNGRDDLALAGGTGWTTIPVAFANTDGTFTVTEQTVPGFPARAATTRARVLSGDVNGDSRDDLVATGGTGWTTIPVAFSNGDGTFTVTDTGVADFPSYTAQSQAKVAIGRFHDAGPQADLAVAGPLHPSSTPVAVSDGIGGFTVVNRMYAPFPGYAAQATQMVAGDFNGDGRDDLAVSGGANWPWIPLAFANGDGGFTPSLTPTP
ncbi:S8 family serine peptidase [Micromonospora sp. CPCC 206060]|uniref:S8 family serine peptidase n=1 Tax=Micromonospora sp. CPCC 206060 TaxID=3122406 RepID=UPI002FF1E02E